MPVAIVDGLVFPSTLNTRSDGDAVNAANVLANCNQGLADRTNNLVNRTGGATAVGEFRYLAASGLASPRTRTRIISPFQLDTHTAQSAGGNDSWYGTLGRSLTSLRDFPRLHLDLNQLLPDSALVTMVRVIVTPGAARAVQTTTPGDKGRMYTQMLRSTPDFAPGPGIPVYAVTNAIEDAGGTARQVITMSGMSESVIKGSSWLLWQLVGGDDAGTNNDVVDAVEVTYNDQGPQNF